MLISYATLCEAFQHTAAIDPDAVALRVAGGGGEITWREYADRVRRIAGGLAALGVRHGDPVALMTANRPEFHLVDTAAIHLGAAPFSIYNTSSPEQIGYLLGNAAPAVVCCDMSHLPRMLAGLAEGASSVRHVIVLDGPAGPDARTRTLSRLEELGDPDFDFDGAWRRVRPDDLLTLIYTSGTTGPPKGVELTHANLLAQARSVTSMFELRRTDRVVSYLPSAHIADRLASHYLQMVIGAEVSCVADPRQLGAALVEVRPDVLAAVPRVWEKMRGRILDALLDAPAARRRLFGWALALGLRRVRTEQAGRRLDPATAAAWWLADRLVLARIRSTLGLDRVRWAMSGAASIAVPTLEFFLALGVRVCEIWGMSETCGAGTANPPGRIRGGTVGVALPGVELRLADDGELLIRGEIVTPGYHRDPQRTAEVLDPDGWLHTGDVATFDPDGYLRIVDRKKELIINAAGKNMSPSNIENVLKASCPLIGTVVVVGDDQPYNIALLVLDEELAAAHLQRHGGPVAAPVARLATDPVVLAAVAEGVEAGNARLSRVEQVKAFAVLPVSWDPGGDELTPTLKLRRREIIGKYAAEIDELYRRPRLS